MASPITLFGGLSLGIVLFAVWYSLRRSVAALVLLWLCTLLLIGATVLAQFGIWGDVGQPYVVMALEALGINTLFVPAAVLALVASIAGTVAARQRVPART